MISFIGRAKTVPRASDCHRLAWRAPRSPGRRRAPSRARRDRVAATAASGSPDRLRAALRGLRDRLLRLPDLPGLRLLLLAAVGPRAAARAACRSSTGFRYPTEHPLAIAAGARAVSSSAHVGRPPLGRADPRARSWRSSPASTGSAGSPPRRWSARSPAALLLTRFDYPFLAARGYIDIPYMALVVWAAVLEATRPRRGTPVLLLLAARRACCAPRRGCWPALYWLWLAWRRRWRERVKFAALAAIGPVSGRGRRRRHRRPAVLACTTRAASAEDLGRQRRSSELPAAVPAFFATSSSCRCSSPRVLGLVLGVVIVAAADA